MEEIETKMRSPPDILTKYFYVVSTMVKFNVHCLEETDAPNPIRAAGATTTVRKEKKHSKWTVADMTKCQLQFCMSPGLSIKRFCMENLLTGTTDIPEKTFGTHWTKSGLKNLQGENTPFKLAKIPLENHVLRVKEIEKKRTSLASQSHRCIAEQEENTFVHMALATGKAGRGVDKEELLEMINSVINVDVDDREKEEATDKAVRDILKWHPDLMKLVNTGSLDPLRAKKANRDTVFSKLQAQTRGLHAEGKIPWKNYSEIPSNCVHNMDEVGTDTTKHRRKVIADKRNTFQRIFTIAPEGDRMKGHTTACIATRADGEFKDYCFWVFECEWCSFLFYSVLLTCG
jgi:hypothetical protein